VQMRRPTDMPRRTDCDSAMDCRGHQRVPMHCVDIHVCEEQNSGYIGCTEKIVTLHI
jgi:hypothetical protein